MKAHWGAIAATDFFTVKVLTAHELIRYFVLFVIDLETRRVEIAGVIHQPCEDWMKQRVIDNRVQHFSSAGGSERKFACEHLEEHDTQAEDVASRIDILTTGLLLPRLAADQR